MAVKRCTSDRSLGAYPSRSTISGLNYRSTRCPTRFLTEHALRRPLDPCYALKQRAKIKKGIWLEKIHWRKAPDNRILFNLLEIEAWKVGRRKGERPEHPA